MLFFITFVVLAHLQAAADAAEEAAKGPWHERRRSPPTSTPATAARRRLHAKRKLVNAVALALSLAAMAFGLFWLIWILIETVRLGLGGLALSLFTEMTPPPQAETGGLANAIFGSVMMVALATLLGTPIGVLAGIYLAEYGQGSWLGAAPPASSTTSCCRRRRS